MSNSERGIKFRERQREREATLSQETDRLRDEIQRLQVLRDLCEAKSLASEYCTAAVPMKFIMEYFQQFRIGLHVPNAPATPHTKFGGKPAVEMILSIWEHYSRFHTSVKLELESADLITGKNWSSVAVRGILHLRYSRRTIQHVFPSAIGDEELIQKLISRQLHVHYRAQMHFNAYGRLEGYEITPAFVGALMEVLGSIRGCERMLGRALIKGHVLGEKAEQSSPGLDVLHRSVERLPLASFVENRWVNWMYSV
ncbi:hypothetical protein PHYSODRAFT_315222 [Phytophthora sojae]|uniref:Uncharacterized protein n=1 Tax=Phytophthora sojae (strain P6497) TaxID=1094619 RepID=G4ZDN3_PHYSP|nr:hypothetical protein PHYSODRAFT_315222 [Phytophthora sojae]EGZ18372.1 hypothetical protein PHYSODRAFT_315222 [Phytophthora sojae]|eukprot:XP_009527430.1 hypothetical protein PHYSODRAFT_315222 [Phytophthora sojae]